MMNAYIQIFEGFRVDTFCNALRFMNDRGWRNKNVRSWEMPQVDKLIYDKVFQVFHKVKLIYDKVGSVLVTSALPSKKL